MTTNLIKLEEALEIYKNNTYNDVYWGDGVFDGLVLLHTYAKPPLNAVIRDAFDGGISSIPYPSEGMSRTAVKELFRMHWKLEEGHWWHAI